MRAIATWLLLTLSSLLMAAWCLFFVPLLQVPPLVAFAMSLPLAFGITLALTLLTWRDL